MTTFANVGGVAREVLLSDGPGDVRVSQTLAETLANAPPHHRVSQIVAEVLDTAPPDHRVTQVFAEIICRPPPPPLGTPQIYPELCGLSFDVVRRVIWENATARHVSGREVRLPYFTLPRYEWDLIYDVLKDFPLGTIPSELKRLEGFFLEKRAAFSDHDSNASSVFGGFLFRDPDDCQVTGQVIGATDASNRIFTLVRSFGDAAYGAVIDEPVGYINLDEPFNVYLNGVLQGASRYTIAQGYPGAASFASGVGGSIAAPCQLVFARAPAAGQTITVDMSYYFWARFNDDYADFEKFADRFWLLRKITLDSLRIPSQ